MRQVLFAFSFICFVLPCTAQWGRFHKEKQGNGDIQQETRTVKQFDGLSTCCSTDVFLTKGDRCELRIEADANLLASVITEVREGVLSISLENDRGTSIRPSKRIKVYVTMPTITSLAISSSSSLTSNSAFTGTHLKINATSSSRSRISFEGKSVDVHSSSSAKVDLSGSADEFVWNGSSSSKVDARDFVAKRAVTRSSSSASLFIDVIDELDARANSSSKVRYKRCPSTLLVKTSSSGKIYEL